VSSSGTKSWIFRFTLDGRAREMGLGPLHAIPLADARKRAAECRRMRLDGIDPIEARSEHRSWKKLEAARGMTFDACAAAYLDAHNDGWRNAKHREQWRNTLSSYAGPVFGSVIHSLLIVGPDLDSSEPVQFASHAYLRPHLELGVGRLQRIRADVYPQTSPRLIR
jgi:hypothetical protein